MDLRGEEIIRSSCLGRIHTQKDRGTRRSYPDETSRLARLRGERGDGTGGEPRRGEPNNNVPKPPRHLLPLPFPLVQKGIFSNPTTHPNPSNSWSLGCTTGRFHRQPDPLSSSRRSPLNLFLSSPLLLLGSFFGSFSETNSPLHPRIQPPPLQRTLLFHPQRRSSILTTNHSTLHHRPPSSPHSSLSSRSANPLRKGYA